MNVRDLIKLLVGRKMDSEVMLYNGENYYHLEPRHICNGNKALVINIQGQVVLRPDNEEKVAKQCVTAFRAENDLLHTQLNLVRGKVKHCQSEIRRMDQRARDEAMHRERLVAKITRLRANIDARRLETESLLSKMDVLRVENAQFERKKLESTENRQLKSQVKDRNDEINNLDGYIGRLGEKNASLVEQVEQLESQVKMLESRCESFCYHIGNGE